MNPARKCAGNSAAASGAGWPYYEGRATSPNNRVDPRHYS